MNMDPNKDQFREQMEVRIVALLLGETSPFETAELQEAMKKDPSLAAFHDEMRSTIGLVAEASKVVSPATAPEPKLSPERREVLLSKFKEPEKKAKLLRFPKLAPSFIRPAWLTPLTVAAGILLVGLLAGLLLPASLAKAKAKAQRMKPMVSAALEPVEVDNLKDMSLANRVWEEHNGRSLRRVEGAETAAKGQPKITLPTGGIPDVRDDHLSASVSKVGGPAAAVNEEEVRGRRSGPVANFAKQKYADSSAQFNPGQANANSAPYVYSAPPVTPKIALPAQTLSGESKTYGYNLAGDIATATAAPMEQKKELAPLPITLPMPTLKGTPDDLPSGPHIERGSVITEAKIVPLTPPPALTPPAVAQPVVPSSPADHGLQLAGVVNGKSPAKMPQIAVAGKEVALAETAPSSQDLTFKKLRTTTEGQKQPGLDLYREDAAQKSAQLATTYFNDAQPQDNFGADYGGGGRAGGGYGGYGGGGGRGGYGSFGGGLGFTPGGGAGGQPGAAIQNRQQNARTANKWGDNGDLSAAPKADDKALLGSSVATFATKVPENTSGRFAFDLGSTRDWDANGIVQNKPADVRAKSDMDGDGRVEGIARNLRDGSDVGEAIIKNGWFGKTYDTETSKLFANRPQSVGGAGASAPLVAMTPAPPPAPPASPLPALEKGGAVQQAQRELTSVDELGKKVVQDPRSSREQEVVRSEMRKVPALGDVPVTGERFDKRRADEKTSGDNLAGRKQNQVSAVPPPATEPKLTGVSAGYITLPSLPATETPQVQLRIAESASGAATPKSSIANPASGLLAPTVPPPTMAIVEDSVQIADHEKVLSFSEGDRALGFRDLKRPQSEKEALQKGLGITERMYSNGTFDAPKPSPSTPPGGSPSESPGLSSFTARLNSLAKKDSTLRGFYDDNAPASGPIVAGKDVSGDKTRKLKEVAEKNWMILDDDAKPATEFLELANRSTNVTLNDHFLISDGTAVVETNSVMSYNLDFSANEKQLAVNKRLEGIQQKLAELAKPQAAAPKDQLKGKVSDEGDRRPPPANAPTPQPEIATRDNAFSTFSLNVSDVSFKLAASSLEQGAMPEPATIRVEEFVNAFNYRDPAPKAGARLAFAWERARYPFGHNRDLLRFSVQTAARGRESSKPLNLVLLMDCSGSMERPDRVEIMREALKVLASKLQPQDKISVVAFARTARLWVDGMAGGKPKEFLAKVIDLNPQGGTNLEDAMALAYAAATRHFMANGVNRVILLTDGAANLGNVDPETLKERVVDHRKKGIALDCFGIGWEGYNDDLLEVLSRNGDGRYGFMDSPDEAGPEFANQLAGALNVAASDVKTQVEFNPKRVQTWRQIGYAKHQLTKEQFRDNTVDAAEIAAAESGNALYVVQANEQGSGPIGVVRVRFKVPETGEYVEQEWTIPYQPKSPAIDQASSAMKLACVSAGFGEWLSRSPYAAEVTLSALQRSLTGVPEAFAPDPRPQRLANMLRQAQSLGAK